VWSDDVAVGGAGRGPQADARVHAGIVTESKRNARTTDNGDCPRPSGATTGARPRGPGPSPAESGDHGARPVYAARRYAIASYASMRSLSVRRADERICDTRDSLTPSRRPTSAPWTCLT